jgi:two-component system sensor kinase FixL
LQEQHAELLHVARLGELGQMVAAIAHEVNQPLTAIILYLRAGRRLLATPKAADPGKLDIAINKAAEQAVRTSESSAACAT